MNISKASVDFLTKISTPLASKDEGDRQARIRATLIVLIVVVALNILYWWRFI